MFPSAGCWQSPLPQLGPWLLSTSGASFEQPEMELFVLHLNTATAWGGTQGPLKQTLDSSCLATASLRHSRSCRSRAFV